MVGGEGDDQLWGSGRGGIAGCYGWGGRPTWRSGRGAIAGCLVVCYGWGEGDDQLWGSGRGAIAGCHCSVLWLGGRARTNFGGVDVVPLLGAVVVCYGGGGVTTKFGGVDVVPLITQKLGFAIWGLCWYNLCITKLYIPYHFGHLKINPLFSCFNWWFYSGVTESFISMRGQMSACLLCLQQEAELVRLALEMSLQEKTMQNVAWGRRMVPCLKLA